MVKVYILSSRVVDGIDDFWEETKWTDLDRLFHYIKTNCIPDPDRKEFKIKVGNI